MKTYQKLEIYPKRRRNALGLELKQMQESHISPKNKELIRKFRDFRLSTTAKELRVAKLSSQLRRICEHLEKDLDTLIREDVQAVVSSYNQIEHYSDATKADYKRAIKEFYKWFRDEDLRLESEKKTVRIQAQKLYRYLEKDLKTSYRTPKADPKTILTDEDIDYVLEHGCKNMKEKALLKFLHETGVRAGELLNMRVGDVEFNKDYAMARVDGKTGERHIPIVTSVPFLVRYLELHPYRNDKFAFLWVGYNIKCLHEPLLHTGTQKLIERCFEQAGLIKKHYIEAKTESGKLIKKLVKKEVNKKCNLHWFRHSRATLLAPYLTEQILCKYMGWAIGSNQIKTYTHLSVKQVTDAVLDVKGIKNKEEPEYKDNPIKCVCDTINEPKAKYCYKCGKPLSIEVAIQGKEAIDEETNKTMQFMMEMTKNPELMEKFTEFREAYLKRKSQL